MPSNTKPLTNEARRILAEYERREREIGAERYSLVQPVNLFFHYGRSASCSRLLAQHGFLPLAGRKVLEVGCGHGGWLPDFEAWGVRRRDLAGIELDPNRAAAAAERLGATATLEGGRGVGADIREGDAESLPWEDETFDLVVQSTVFTSVLDAGSRARIAAEMRRVLRPAGAILWYDFTYDNPRNPSVRGIRVVEIRRLFPDLTLSSARVTLAPPLARFVVPRAPALAALLESARLLNTHVLALLTCRREARQGAEQVAE